MFSTPAAASPVCWLTPPAADFVVSEPTRLTTMVAAPSAAANSTATTAMTERDGPGCTGADGTCGRSQSQVVYTGGLACRRSSRLRGVEVASEEAARAPKPH